MQAIYKPKGRALEYSPLALNLYTGCTHGCIYCYAPKVLHMDRAEFHSQAVPRKGILEALERQCAKWQGPKERVLLCFTSDPYQREHPITFGALTILKQHGFDVQILTKAGVDFVSDDIHLLSPGQDVIASTLTIYDSKDSQRWEPDAPCCWSRLELLDYVHRRGHPTWASLEPVIFPEQTLELIKLSAAFVDLYKIGTINYHPLRKKIDWKRFAREAVELCQKLGKPYYLKRDLCELAGLPWTPPEWMKGAENEKG